MLISTLARRMSRNGASIDTAAKLIAEFEKRNGQWSADIDTFKEGVLKAVSSLDWMSQIAWGLLQSKPKFVALLKDLELACQKHQQDQPQPQS